MKDKQPEQHDIIYAIRTAHQSQNQLNLMADQKANILVGTIVLLLTFLFTRIPSFNLTDQWLIALIGVFTMLEVIAALLGIMVIKPRTRYLKQPIEIEDMPNPLFFGFFCRFKEQEYVDYIQHLLTDNESAREALLKDYYQVGLVLKRKFTLLKYAYNFAASGLLFAAIGLVAYYYL